MPCVLEGGFYGPREGGGNTGEGGDWIRAIIKAKGGDGERRLIFGEMKGMSQRWERSRE